MSAAEARRDVIIAEYSYRHEAEFAAGFLADAGIPYRLEADDAGGIDAGVTMSRPARVWVRREDAPAARELLEVTPDAFVSDPYHVDEPPARGTFIGSPETGVGRGEGLDATPTDEVHRPAQSRAERGASRLGGAERAVAATLGVAFVGLAFGFSEVLSGGPGGSVWVLVVLLSGLALVISAMVGRAWGPLRSFLRALSGVAP